MSSDTSELGIREVDRTSEYIKTIRRDKCKQANCGIFDSCVLKGLTMLCGCWINEEEYYAEGETWKNVEHMKLVVPDGVTEEGWLYTCENCGSKFEMMREIHIPLCLNCRMAHLDRLTKGTLFLSEVT